MMSFDYQNKYGIPLKHVKKNHCPMRNKLLMKKNTLLMFNAYTTLVNSDGDRVILNVSLVCGRLCVRIPAGLHLY